MKASARPWRVLRGALLFVAALILFIEDFAWKPLAAWLGKLSRWAPIARAEERIRGVAARTALALFLVPAVLLVPVKLAALGLIHGDHPALGVVIILVAKIAGTAFVGRLFVLLEPQLTQFRAFRVALRWWRATKVRIYTALRVSALRQRLRNAYRDARGWWHNLMR